MTPKGNEIVAIDAWGSTPGAPEVMRFLAGPQRRVEELIGAMRIFLNSCAAFGWFISLVPASLLEFMSHRLVAEKTIDGDNLDRFIVTDSPREAVEAISDAAQRRFGLT